MATRLPGRAYHPPRYADANDPGGPERAAAAGDRWIDYDLHLTADRVWANLHWPIPALDGFRFTPASVTVGVHPRRVGRLCWRPVRTMRWRVVRTLRTRDGRRIQAARGAFRRAAAAGIGTEADVKVTPSRRRLQDLADAAAAAYGPTWQRRTLLKRSSRMRGWMRTLRRGKAVGFKTAVLRHDGQDLPKFVDHFRP